MNALTSRTEPSRLLWLLLLPLAAYVLYLLAFAVDVPWFDDIEVLPGTVVYWLQHPAWADRLRWLWQPNNEHRVLYAKGVSALFYTLTGHHNVRAITLFSNWSLGLLLWVFYRIIRQAGLPRVYFLPLPFLLLTPQFYLCNLWSITSLQYHPVVAFGFAAMYLLSRPGRLALPGAVALAALAMSTMSNGLLFWPAGLLLLLLARRWQALAVWALASAACMGLYFYGYPSGEANAMGIAYFLKHPHESLLGFFTFLGGCFDFWNQRPIGQRALVPTIAGVLMVGGCVYAVAGLLKNAFSVAGKIRPHALALLGGLAFLLANAALIGLLRPRFGYFVMLVGNYKIYPVVLLMVCYTLYVITRRPGLPPRLWPLLAGSVAFWALSYLKYLPEAAERRQNLLAAGFNQQHNKIGLAAQRGSAFAAFTAAVMDTLSQRKIYHYPPAFNGPMGALPLSGKKLPVQPQRLSFTITQSEPLTLHNATFSVPPATPYTGLYLLLQSDKATYLLAVAARQEWGVFGPVRPGFGVSISGHLVEPGTYEAGFVLQQGDSLQGWLAGRQVQVLPPSS